MISKLSLGADSLCVAGLKLYKLATSALAGVGLLLDPEAKSMAPVKKNWFAAFGMSLKFVFKQLMPITEVIHVLVSLSLFFIFAVLQR